MLKKVLCFFQRGIPKFYQYVVLGLFFLILFYLAFLSLISTSGVYSSEVTYFVQDSIILNLAAFLVVLLLACAIKIFRPTAHWLQCIQTDSQLFFRYRRILLAILAAVAVIWVLAIQCQPGADQLAVQNAVYGLNTGDYSSFTDGYIAMRHHQLSFTWISYLFSVVFGSYNSVAFQVFNVVGLVLCLPGVFRGLHFVRLKPQDFFGNSIYRDFVLSFDYVLFLCVWEYLGACTFITGYSICAAVFTATPVPLCSFSRTCYPSRYLF